MSGGPDLDLYEILPLLKKSNLCMSVLYFALNYLVRAFIFSFFLICIAFLQESSCLCAKSSW